MSSRVWKEDHVHEVREHEQEWAEGACEVPRRKMAGDENEE